MNTTKKQLEQQNKELLKQLEAQKAMIARMSAKKRNKFSLCNESCKKSSSYHFNMNQVLTEQILKSDKFKAFIVDVDVETLTNKESDVIVNNQFKDKYLEYVIDLVNKDLNL
jgi:hypothetical protein